MSAINIETHVDPNLRPVETDRLEAAAGKIIAMHSFDAAEISIAVINDEAMHALNRQHLQHDYPTDVLSFVYETSAKRLEGEVIVSLDTAEREAARYGWKTADELLLYVVHGTLHLVGHDDHSADERRVMRAREREILAEFGLQPHDDETNQGRSSATLDPQKG